MADRSDREQEQPTECRRRHSLISRMGPCSRTPSGPAVSTDCVNRPDRRLHPTNATASNLPLQRGGHPQKTFSGSFGMSQNGCHERKSPGYSTTSRASRLKRRNALLGRHTFLSQSFFGLACHHFPQDRKNDRGRPTKQQHAVHRRHWAKQLPALNRSHVAVTERCVVYKGKIDEIGARRCNAYHHVSK